MKPELTEEDKKRISDRHKENTFVIELPNGGRAVKFYDTHILEHSNGKITFTRHPTIRNEITRRNMKFYTHLFFQARLVIKDWKTDTPMFRLNNTVKHMENNEVVFTEEALRC